MPDLMGADSAEKGPFAMFAMDIYFHFKISHKGHMHIYISNLLYILMNNYRYITLRSTCRSCSVLVL